MAELLGTGIWTAIKCGLAIGIWTLFVWAGIPEIPAAVATVVLMR